MRGVKIVCDFRRLYMSGDAPVPLPDSTLLLSAYAENSSAFPFGLLIALIVLVFLSGFFSMTETAFTGANRIKLRTLAAGGNARAKKVLDLAENKFDKLISVLLVGNNIINLTASTLCVLFFQKILWQTQSPDPYFPLLLHLPCQRPHP